MSKSQTLFKPMKAMPFEPYRLMDEIELTKKDRIIIDYFLENGNQPTHECGIERGVIVEDKSGRKLRAVTKKHVGDRCRYLEKVGILKHVSKKPLRGAGYRTPHYFLNDDIEAFQILVDIYLKRENPMRMLIFMQSSYLDKAITKNISALLVRWLLPDEQIEFENKLLLFLLHEKIKRISIDLGKDNEDKNLSKQDTQDRSGSKVAVNQLMDALKMIDRKEVEEDILSLFERLSIFTVKQKNMYTDIVKLSPTALHMLVFLPFPDLLEQYEELGLTDILIYPQSGRKRKTKQEQVWSELNRVIHKLLFHSMTVDLMRYPFLILPKRKRVILDGILHPAKQ